MWLGAHSIWAERHSPGVHGKLGREGSRISAAACGAPRLFNDVTEFQIVDLWLSNLLLRHTFIPNSARRHDSALKIRISCPSRYIYPSWQIPRILLLESLVANIMIRRLFTILSLIL